MALCVQPFALIDLGPVSCSMMFYACQPGRKDVLMFFGIGNPLLLKDAGSCPLVCEFNGGEAEFYRSVVVGKENQQKIRNL